DGEYAVFPSRGDVEVIKKLPEGFHVRGPVGKAVDFRVVGKHRDNKDTYWVDMSEKTEPLKKVAREIEAKVKKKRDFSKRPERTVRIPRRRNHAAIKTRRHRHTGASRESDKSNER